MPENGNNELQSDVQPLVQRKNLFTTIKSLLTKYDIVLLEGEDGIGRTTLANDIAMDFGRMSLPVFIHPATQWGFDPRTLQEVIAEEMMRVSGRQLPDASLQISESDYQLLIQEQQRRFRRSGEIVVVIVDGIDELIASEAELRASLLATLPLGIPGFKFILSWNDSIAFPAIPRVRSKSFPLPSLSDTEAAILLTGLGLPDDRIFQFNLLCRGIPGRLASVRRLLLDQVEPRVASSDVEEFANSLLELEWRPVLDESPECRQVIALIAYDPLGLNLAQIQATMQIDEMSIIESIQKFRFLDKKGGHVAFISDPFRRFVQRRLTIETQQVLEKRIDAILDKPQTDETIEQLPSLLDAAHRYNDLIELLSPNFYHRAIDRKKSLNALKRSNAMGLKAAKREKRDAAILQLSLNHSIFVELSAAELWRAEIHARMSLGDYENAVKIASSSPLIEDRLCLLALVAKLKRNNSTVIEEELLDSIRQAYAIVELDYSEAKVVQLATDLIAVLPEVSIDITNKLRNGKQGIEIDVAVASILMQADFIENPESTDKLAALDDLRNQILSPQVRALSEVAPRLLGRTSDAEEIIRESEKIESLELRLPLLETWVSRNRRTNQAARVAEKAIEMMLAKSTFLPTCRHFRKLLICLPYCSDAAIRKTLIETTNAVMGVLERRGPTLDYVRLSLLLLAVESEFGTTNEVDSQLTTLADYVNRVTLESTRAECYAAVWAFLHQAESQQILARNQSLEALILTGLESILDKLFLESASHFVLSKVVVQTLARGDLNTARIFSLKLNTERRRDQALVAALESASSLYLSNCDFKLFASVLNNISDHRTRYSAVSIILRQIARNIEQSNSTVADSMQLFGEISLIDNASVRCTALANLRLLLEFDSAAGVVDAKSLVEALLLSSWQAIDRLWDRIRIGYEICAVAGQRIPQLAKTFLESSNSLKNESSILAPETAFVALSAIRLTLAAMSGLMQKDLVTDKDILRVKRLIDSIPSFGEQSLLWADLAQRFIISGNEKRAHDIVYDHILPSISQIPVGDNGFKEFILVFVSQVFWYANPVTTKEDLGALPRQLRDEAYVNLCEFMLRKEPLFEPFAYSGKASTKTDYSTLVKVVDLLAEIDDDTNLSTLTEHIVDASACRSNRLTVDQTSDIVRRLENVMSRKFPCKHGIKHDGYRIYCEANIGRIKKSFDWAKSISDASKIPNLADRGHVMAKIASHLPPKLSATRDQLLNQVLADSISLPACFDRVQALSNIATIYEGFDKSKCKRILIDAMTYANQSEPYAASSLRRNIIDLSHRIDPGLAQELVSGLDDDPARLQARIELKHEIEVLDAARNIQKQTSKNLSQSKPGFRESSGDAVEKLPSPEVLPSMAWRALAQLNGGVGIAYSPNELKDFVAGASTLPLSTSFPVLNWALSCASKLYCNTDQAGTILRQLFESTYASTALCLGLIARCSTGMLSPTSQVLCEVPRDSTIVHAGDSTTGLSVIHNWIHEKVDDFLLVCDPYLNIEDLAVLKYVLETRRNITVTLVSDLSRFDDKTVVDQFNAHWRQIMAMPPPVTDIVLMVTESTKTFPIHDRWWVTKGSGLRIGTSLNGLGVRRASEISEVGEVEALQFFQELEPFISRQVRSHAGERLKFRLFSLE